MMGSLDVMLVGQEKLGAAGELHQESLLDGGEINVIIEFLAGSSDLAAD